jgi:hypothetical protein
MGQELTPVLDAIRQDPDIRRAYMVGSVTQKGKDPNDLDLLLEVGPETARNAQAHLATMMTAARGDKNVLDKRLFRAGPIGTQPYREMYMKQPYSVDAHMTLPPEFAGQGPKPNPYLQGDYFPGLMPHDTKYKAELIQEMAQEARGYKKGNMWRIKALAPLLGLGGVDGNNQ